MRVLFWGTPHFAVPTLRALSEEGHHVVGVVTQPDRPAGRGRTLTPSPVKEVALEEGIPVLQPELPRGDEFMAEIRALDPEISVVVAYGHILREDVLELPPLGSWNVHASLLPELRGAAPIHWAIARGLDESGVTVMRMARGMDAGPMIHQVAVPIEPDESSSELSLRLSEIGAQSMIEALAYIEMEGVEAEEQDHSAATFAPKVSREVARIDWSRSAREVSNHVRGMDDVPGAWTQWNGQPLKLFHPMLETDDRFEGGPAQPADAKPADAQLAESQTADAQPAEAQPGQVIRADPDRTPPLVIATGDGVVGFSQAQPPGKRRMDAAAWLRGKGASAGDRLE